MPESTVPYTKRDAVIVFSDAGAVHTYTVAYEPGDLSITIPGSATTRVMDRGSIENVVLRKGDDAPCELSFSTYMRNVAGDDHATLLDIANRFQGGYVETNWVSTGETEVFTLDVAIIFSGADFGAADEEMHFAKCEVRASLAEGDPNTINVTITANVEKPTIV
jgi:hypothetical protein